MTSPLLKDLATDMDLWQEGIQKSNLKGIPKRVLDELITPEVRDSLIASLEENKGDFGIPHIALIPKPAAPNEFREVMVENPLGRVVLSMITNILFKHYRSLVHKACKSYQKGLGTKPTIEECSRKVQHAIPDKNGVIGVKLDFHHFFDTVKKEKLYELIDKMEDMIGMERGTDPVLNLIRRIYNNNNYIDSEGQIANDWRGIRQGNPLAAFFADVILYDLDEHMSSHYPYYCRYSDDCIIVTEYVDQAMKDIERFSSPYGVMINPKKTEYLYKDRYFTFLGFAIKGGDITISKERLRLFKISMKELALSNYKDSYKKILRSVLSFLYGNPKSELPYCWGTFFLPVMNVEEDIQELNKYVMDVLRAVKTNRRHISNPGYEPEKHRKKGGDHYVRKGVVTYSPTSGGVGGKNVGRNFELVGREIEGYMTLMDAKKLMSYSKDLFFIERKKTFNKIRYIK